MAFSVVIAVYDLWIFAVFLVLSILSTLWILIFMKRRKHLDYKRFQSLRDNQDSLLEIITGMQEIKLNNSELSKRWEWERVQVKLFKINMKTLLLNQYQRMGFLFINRFKNIFISYLAALQAIQGDMTLGMMLSLSYIIGQTNEPLRQIVNFFTSSQDAKISLERLHEIHQKSGEESLENGLALPISHSFQEDIVVEDVTFQYGGPNSPVILDDISLTIPKGKVTAIVGVSGSGKTTLMKLLLKFYDPVRGHIKLGIDDLSSIPGKLWRRNCGTVMQDGYIFSTSIARNVALSGEKIDRRKLYDAIEIANLSEFVKEQPSGYTTLLGAGGSGLSGGQKQRLLIARAVYKDPEFLFFDEATSSLDAENERIIMDNLDAFFAGKTVVIIAH
ncbi:MAG: ATP-binding cassette domain-containing protein, partial [Bacteroidota bacterium]